MPWKETGPVLERARFIDDYLSGLYTITELAARYGVSRRILHKWLSRHDANGAAGLIDRSRAPLHIPHRTADDVAAEVIAFRRRFPHMGPRKIAVRLAEIHPDVEWAGTQHHRRHPRSREPHCSSATSQPAASSPSALSHPSDRSE